MSLLSLRGEAVIEAIADLIPAIVEIAEDDKVKTFFTEARKKASANEDKEAAERDLKHDIAVAMPQLLKDHSHAVMAIMAAVKGVPVDEYAQTLSVASLFKDLAAVMNDQDFVQLFLSQLNEAGVTFSEKPKVRTQGRNAFRAL